MPDLAAPYFSANELTSQPGDASLSGVNANFDPAVKVPLAPLQGTMDRIDTENFNAQQQQKQRQFQQQQQGRQFQQDILQRHMAQDHEEKILKYQEGLKNRQQLFNMFNQTGATSASLKDANGNPMSIPFLPEDNDKLTQETNDFHKWAFENPSQNLYSPELTQKMGELQQKRNNASLRTYYYKQAEQSMDNAYDPQEKARLQNYMEDLKSQPLTADKMPHPFVEQPSVKPLIDVEKDYKEGKGFEEFGDSGSGVPNARYLGLASSTDPRMVNEGFKRYQFFRSQPEGQDPQAFQGWKQRLDELTDARELPRFNFPAAVTKDGSLQFDDGTYAKKQALARNFLAATELMNNGYLKQPDSEDALKEKELEARVDKEKAGAQKERIEAALKQKELTSGKPLTAEETANQRSARAMYNQVQKVFSPSGSPVGVQYPAWWERNGVDPSKENIYHVSAEDAAKYIGIEDPHKKTKKSGNGVETTTETKGQSVRPDHVFLIEDKTTGDKHLMYVKDNKSIAKVPENDAAINGLKHEAKYDPKIYEKQASFIEDAYKKADDSGASTSDNNEGDGSESEIRARLIPITIKKKDGSLIKAYKDPKTGKRYAA